MHTAHWLLLALLAGCSAGGAAAQTRAASATTSGGTAPALATADSPYVGQTAPEFPSTDPSRWVNGAPFTLASARGSVVLVESWHRL
jgi:hypothetical protein